MAKARAKNRKRYDSGRVVPISLKALEQSNKSVVLEYRQRHHGAPGTKTTDDVRFESVLGRMCLQKLISDVQYQVGNEYGERRRAYLAIKSPHAPTPGTGGFELVSRDTSGNEGMSQSTIDRIERQGEDIERVVGMLERSDPAMTKRAIGFTLMELLDRVTVYDLEVAQSPVNLGAIRSAFNEMAREFGFSTVVDLPRK